MRHPHADLIKEWAEDTSRVVQWRYPKIISSDWKDCPYEHPDFDPDYEWRFKPEPKPDVVRYAWARSIGSSQKIDGDNIKLTFDGETGELKSAEVFE